MPETPVLVDVSQMSWALLTEQKISLLKVLKDRSMFYGDDETDPLEGILELVDFIQDSAANTIGKEAVFGPRLAEDE